MSWSNYIIALIVTLVVSVITHLSKSDFYILFAALVAATNATENNILLRKMSKQNEDKVE